MRIAKPILLVSTPIGVAGGLYEAWQQAKARQPGATTGASSQGDVHEAH
jgi:hypothetical protein